MSKRRVEGKFDFILERARKRTPAQTRQRLIEIGILTKDGELADHYKRGTPKVRKVKPKQPGEVMTFCDGYKPLSDANKVLKEHGLILRWRTTGGGDQVWLRVEKREKSAN